MGLDATVYCDCYERGHLRVPPSPKWRVYVDRDGSRSAEAEDLDEQFEADAWMLRTACEHDGGRLLHHYLGNIALIERLHDILIRHAERLPIILEKVLYSGTHAGDYLELAQVQHLKEELHYLAEIHDSDRLNERFVRDFERQMRELVRVSLTVGKPIAF